MIINNALTQVSEVAFISIQDVAFSWKRNEEYWYKTGTQ